MKYMQLLMKRIILPCCLCLTACIQEEQIMMEENNNMKSEARMNFSLVIPSQTQMQTQTRAPLEEGDENKVLSVRVLLFKEETPGNKTYYFGVTKNNIITVMPEQKNFDVTLPTGIYDVVILANAQEILDQSNISLGDTKENVLNALVETNAGKWNRDNLPMWGRIDRLTVSAENGFDNTKPVEMIRMMAKIDLEVAPAVIADFILEDVRLYNYSSRGALVPNLATWPADNKPTLPVEPDGGYAPVATPQVFDSNDGVTDTGCRRLIYACEAPAGSNATPQNNTCLVVGGKYKGGNVTYYRIDFIRKDNNNQKEFLPLLRNNYYLVKIQNVSSRGYDTPEKALSSPAVNNMEAVLLNWAGSDMSNVVFDENHMLAVSTNQLMLSADPLTIRTVAGKIIVRSSVPEGWKVERITDPNNTPITWLTLFSNTPTAAGELFVCAEENTSAAERRGYIYITSGKLQQRVEVVQSATCGFGLEIIDESSWQEITTLDFSKTSAGQKKFKVIWKPATAIVTITTVANQATAFSGYGLPPDASFTDSNGWREYTIITSGTVANDRLTRLDFTLSDGGANINTRALFIRQK